MGAARACRTTSTRRLDRAAPCAAGRPAQGKGRLKITGRPGSQRPSPQGTRLRSKGATHRSPHTHTSGHASPPLMRFDNQNRQSLDYQSTGITPSYLPHFEAKWGRKRSYPLTPPLKLGFDNFGGGREGVKHGRNVIVCCLPTLVVKFHQVGVELRVRPLSPP
jgi:hypothetical protein